MEKEAFFFNAENLSFYLLSLKPDYVAAGSWPENMVEVSQETFEEFTNSIDPGKVRGADKNGNPVWVDVPPPTDDQVVKNNTDMKLSLLSEASLYIAPLQDAVDLEMATDEEISMLNKWKKYRISLNRLDMTSRDVTWPEKPQ